MKASRLRIAIAVALCLAFALAPAFGQTKVQKPNWGWSTPADYTKATGKTISRYNEAPMLSDLVKAGKLPPLAKRLPAEPLVDNPFNEVGRYGGSMTLGQVSAAISYPAGLHMMEMLLQLDRNAGNVVPNIAKGWAYSDGGKTFTLSLRKGLKWSDGVDFTADDILFYWEDIILNKDLNPAGPPVKFAPGGQPMKVTAVDPYTVKFQFAVPNYNFHLYLASIVFTGCQGDIYECKHYLKQFHIKYNPDADKLAKAAKFDSWAQLFDSKRYFWYQVWPKDLPTMGPWIVSEILPQGVVYTRNPYYYKVDTAGNQLPYIDKVISIIFNDSPTMTLKMVAGEFDYQDWSTSVGDYPAYMAAAGKDNYDIWMAPSLWSSVAAYTVNQNYSGDQAIGDILRDVRFRQALSLALNRDEINQVIALGRRSRLRFTQRQASIKKHGAVLMPNTIPTRQTNC